MKWIYKTLSWNWVAEILSYLKMSNSFNQNSQINGNPNSYGATGNIQQRLNAVPQGNFVSFFFQNQRLTIFMI